MHLIEEVMEDTHPLKVHPEVLRERSIMTTAVGSAGFGRFRHRLSVVPHDHIDRRNDEHSQQR